MTQRGAGNWTNGSNNPKEHLTVEMHFALDMEIVRKAK